MAFGHLHVHTDYSLLDGLCKVDKLVERAKELGQTFLASTDHGSTSSLWEFQKACQAAQIKPILGTEFYTNSPEGGRKAGHLVVFAKNNKGLENIYKLQEYAYTTGFSWKPRIDIEILEKYKEGLIVCSACLANQINQYILGNDMFSAQSEIKKMQNIFGDDFYLELQSNTLDEQKRVNEVLLSFAKEMNIKTILTNDVHYVLKDDWFAHEVLLALQTHKKMDDPKRWKFPTTDFWLKSEEEMYKGLEYLNDEDIKQSLNNTQEIADKCEACIEVGNYLPKYYDIPNGMSSRELLVEKAKKGIINKQYQPFVKDIQHEIDVIDSEGLSDYFLIVQDYINSARENNIIVGDGRGSGAGSKLGYVLDIHRVQPDKYNLLFERFLSPGRQPDIDVDFSNQDFVFRDLQKKYGNENVAHIVTFGKMTPKAVSRKVLSAFGHTMKEIKQINSCIGETETSMRHALEISPKLQSYKSKYPKEFEVIEKLEGVISQTGKHAGGILIMENLTSKFPIITSSDDDRTSYTVAYDKKMVEELGGWKFDVLGLETLPVIRRCLNSVKENHGVDVDLYDIDYDDTNVYSALRTGDTSGVFQLGAQAGKVMEQNISNFEDLIAINALIRP